MYLYWLWGTGC